MNIVKELRSRDTEFHTYKLKQERSFKVVFKHIHSINADDIKKGIKNQRYTVTNI